MSSKNEIQSDTRTQRDVKSAIGQNVLSKNIFGHEYFRRTFSVLCHRTYHHATSFVSLHELG